MNELNYSDFLKDETDLEREAGLILEHYGVKGMRWGVRRTPEQLGHITPRHTGKKKPTKQQKARSDRVEAYQNRRLLSDEELAARIRRLELEKRFRELSESDIHPGRTIIKEVLGVAGPNAAKTMTSGAMLYTGKVAMTKKFSWNEAADYITPKPKKK